MDESELRQIVTEAASLVMTFDEALSPSARRENYLRVSRVYQRMRHASMLEIDRAKKRLRSVKSADRERMSAFVDGLETLMHHAIDSVVQIASMAAHEAALHDPERN